MQQKEIIQCPIWVDEPLHHLQQARAVSGPQSNRWRTQSMFPTRILTEDACYRDLGKRKEEELQSELTILNRSFPDPTEYSWQKIQLLGVGVWICPGTAQRIKDKLLTRAVSRIKSSTWLQTLKHTLNYFLQKNTLPPMHSNAEQLFWVLRYFHVHAGFIPLVQTFSKIRSMAPSNLSGVSISRSIICWVKVWNFWGVSLFRILLTLRSNS